MNKLILLFFKFATIAIVLSSCGNRMNNKKLDLSKIEVMKTLEEIRLDSINKQEELKVLGSITFGMSRDEFERSKDEFIEKCKTYYGEEKIYIGKKIGNYTFYSIDGYFYKEKLNYVKISGMPIGYRVYDNNMRIEFDGLFNVLKNKYGNPNGNKGFPDWHTISDNGHGSAYWLIGDKRILMVIVPVQNDRYSLELIIDQISITKLIEGNEERKTTEAVKKGVDLF